MKIIPVLLVFLMISAQSAISLKGASKTKTNKEPVSAPSSSDSYQMPTETSGDLSTTGETSINGARKKIARKKVKENCEVISGKAVCEKMRAMNKSINKKGHTNTATRENAEQVETDLE